VTVERERTAPQWQFDATPLLGRVTRAARRFSVSLAINEVTMLAASDELAVAARDAQVWVAANPCPDLELGTRVDVMLQTCADVALTAQRAITHPAGTIDSVIDHLSNLLAIVEVHAHAVHRW
jgi:hypothetical protein